ncbi:hypothetical protein HDV64DRAFT_163638 [Trichoderma sp. TUCIM 5745]
MANIKALLFALASITTVVKGIDQVGVFLGPDCSFSQDIDIGPAVGSIGPTNCPIIPLDQVEGGEQPDGTYRLWFSPPASLFENGNQLIVRSPAADGLDQCGPINTIITGVGCYEINTAVDIVVQLCADPENCGASS